MVSIVLLNSIAPVDDGTGAYDYDFFLIQYRRPADLLSTFYAPFYTYRHLAIVQYRYFVAVSKKLPVATKLTCLKGQQQLKSIPLDDSI